MVEPHDSAGGGTIERFAASVLHDIRTPLSALAGEVDLARRRERTIAEYRDFVTRVGDRVAELLELTENLALLGNRDAVRARAMRSTPLGSAISALSRRFAETVEIVTGDSAVDVAGDEALITRALGLLLHHALRHRQRESRVRLIAPPHGSPLSGDAAELLIDAPEAGFWPAAWHDLRDGDAALVESAAPLRLRTAALIIRECGGALSLTERADTQALRIHLRKAAEQP